jgi:hypothetical protein
MLAIMVPLCLLPRHRAADELHLMQPVPTPFDRHQLVVRPTSAIGRARAR